MAKLLPLYVILQPVTYQGPGEYHKKTIQPGKDAPKLTFEHLDDDQKAMLMQMNVIALDKPEAAAKS